MSDVVRVLVVDDSAYMRVVLRDMLQSEEGMSVLGTAKDGLEAIAKVKSLKPDVVLLDIQMPKMDGLATLQRIMKECPTRVVMLSAMNKVDVQLPLRALEMGAVDFIPKPSGPVSIDIVRFKKAIADLVRNASLAQIDVLKRMRGPIPVRHLQETAPPAACADTKAVVIAASTGGPRSLEAVFAALPKNIRASIMIVQHLPAEFSPSFAKRLDAANGPKVVLAIDGTVIESGTAYLAPGGFHLRVEMRNRKGVVAKLDEGTPVQFVKPSANVLFESAAKCYGDRLLGVVMTGMGSDGAQGAKVIRAAGGRVIVQDEESSVIFGMAKAVITENAADEVVPLEKIPQKIIEFIEG
jgi:two-component system chemotaxis response regulator CheB